MDTSLVSNISQVVFNACGCNDRIVPTFYNKFNPRVSRRFSQVEAAGKVRTNTRSIVIISQFRGV